MPIYTIKNTRTLEALKTQKNLKLHDTIYPPSKPGVENKLYQVYKDDEGNFYLFDSMIEKQERLAAQSKRASAHAVSLHNKNTIEGRRESLALAIENILNSFAADSNDIDAKIVQSRYPQEKLKSFLAKTIADEVELEAEFMKEFIALTNEVCQEYDNEAELIKKVLANKHIASNPSENNLKKAFEMRLFKLENLEESEDEAGAVSVS